MRIGNLFPESRELIRLQYSQNTPAGKFPVILQNETVKMAETRILLFQFFSRDECSVIVTGQTFARGRVPILPRQ